MGASTHHGKRIASLSAAMGRYLGMDDAAVMGLTTCALFYDNALTEYIFSERKDGIHDPAMKLHCEIGQNNVNMLKIHANIHNFVLYHHERADGAGSFKKKPASSPWGPGSSILRIL
jgi:response regulator RpfG family c-di-GMP phosphodiesterase